MKVAICGTGPLGLEAAWHFHSLGAAVMVFGGSEWGGNARTMAQLMPHLPIQTAHGEISCEDYWQSHLSPLNQKLRDLVVARGPMLRVHKRFLGLEEEVPGKSRMHDLFRVVYQVGVGEDAHENFEDVDIVIDARGVLHNPRPLGASASHALNELSLAKKAALHYGCEIFSAINELKEGEHCLLVGSGSTAALALVQLKDWLFSNPKNQLSLVTSEVNAFDDFFKHSHSSYLKEKLHNLIEENETRWEQQKRDFEFALNEWRQLDEFVRVKMPRPEEPSPQIHLLPGNNVTAIDHLEDREGLFITCESADFRNAVDIKTLAVDRILCATGYSVDTNPIQGLRTAWHENGKSSRCSIGTHPEPGFFTLGAIGIEAKQRPTLKEALEQLPVIEREVLRFFSPAQEASSQELR